MSCGYLGFFQKNITSCILFQYNIIDLWLLAYLSFTREAVSSLFIYILFNAASLALEKMSV